jgi:oxygen-independent coproporphyrinogen-3 oxidase
MQGELSGGRNVLHWDFGSAAQIFNDVQLGQTVDQLQRIFPAGENPKSFFGIEIESTTATVQRVLALRRLGFTDLSITLGARGRKANLSQLVASVRDAEYQELQLTVLGGKSQPDDFTLARRLQDALCFGPDRIFIPGALLGKLHMRLLEDAGYRQISSELYVQRASGARPLILGAFRRFPFGDCSLAGHDLLGIGAGAISMLGAVCCQNERNIGEYCERLERGELPVAYGAVLSFDQLLRRAIMRMLLWDFALSTDAIDQVFFIEFNSYFNRQLQALRSMEEDGLLSLSDGWIRVHDKGRPLIRRICAVFAQTSDLA